MDVWPIKCYVPIADETIARSAFGVKGMNASVYINPLPLELCTEVTNTYLSAYIRAIFAQKRCCFWPPDVFAERSLVFAGKPVSVVQPTCLSASLNMDIQKLKARNREKREKEVIGEIKVKGVLRGNVKCKQN